MAEENKQPEQPKKVGAPAGNQNALGNSGGRPSLYNEGMLYRAKQYLMLFDKDPLNEPIPTAAGMADYLGIGKATLYRWADDEEKIEFRYTMEALQTKQEKLLICLGLTGKLAASGVRLLLMSNHGYAEKSETKADIVSMGERVMGINYIAPAPNAGEEGKSNEDNAPADSEAAPGVPGA